MAKDPDSIGGGLTRATDPDTSHDAADRVPSKIIFGEIEALLKRGGRALVVNEISRYLDRHQWSISPRMVQMEEVGTVVRDGSRYALNSNNLMTRQTIWRLRQDGEALTRPPARRKTPCQWVRDDLGAWGTACGNTFELWTGSPTENRMRFCCYCGKLLFDTPPEPRRRRRTKAEMAAARLPPGELPDWLR